MKIRPPRSFPGFAAALTVAALLCATLPVVARAGLSGQATTPPDAAEKIRAAAADLLKGNIATARPNLLLLVEANATTDLSPLLARVVGDDTTYNGLAATLDEAGGSAKTDNDRACLAYNLARLHLLRARLLSFGTARTAPLNAAARAADRFDPGLRDPAAWELKGDIATERGDLNAALAAYRKIVTSGGGNAFALYKEGIAYARTNRASLAQTTLEAALRAQKTGNSGGPVLSYGIYQELAGVYLMLGNDAAAQTALTQSSRILGDPPAGFRFRTDIARQILRRGNGRVVLAYAEAALRTTPDDFDLQTLRDDARSAPAGRGRR